MQDEPENAHVAQPRPYPWVRAVAVILVYVAFLILLWRFPVASARHFLRNLLQGLAYLLAGLVLLGVTALAILLLLPPGAVKSRKDSQEEELETLEEWELEELGLEIRHVVPAIAIAVPSLRRASRPTEIIARLDEILAEVPSPFAFAVDADNGFVTVMAQTDHRARSLAREVRHRLREAGIETKRP
ncbi:MAG: hypothetical protein ACP5HG_17570 [Anaerolineae bacterium]